MLDRTEVTLLPDGNIRLERYGMVFSHDEAVRLRDNLDRCLSGVGRMVEPYTKMDGGPDAEEEATSNDPKLEEQKAESPPDSQEKVAGKYTKGSGV